MKAKPRVIKRQSGWLVLKPGFGFGDGELIGPFPSQRDAFRYALGRAHAASVNAMKAATPEPSGHWRGWNKMWRPVIR